MSVEAMTWVLNRSTTKGSTRLVMLALANEASTSGEVSAYARSYTHLARLANVSKSTVWRAIEDAVEAGELVVTRSGGGRERNDYRIVMSDCEVQPVAGSNRLQDEVAITPFSPVPDPVPPTDPPSIVEAKPKRAARKPAVVDDAGFEEFWSKYPRRHGVRVGKAKARVQWARIPQAKRPDVMAALDAYAAHCTKTERWPRDAERWLPSWEDWVDVASDAPRPADPERPTRIRNGVREVFSPGAGWCAEARPRELADFEL